LCWPSRRRRRAEAGCLAPTLTASGAPWAASLRLLAGRRSAPIGSAVASRPALLFSFRLRSRGSYPSVEVSQVGQEAVSPLFWEECDMRRRSEVLAGIGDPFTRPEPNTQIATRLAKTPLSLRQISSCERVRRFLPAIFGETASQNTPDTGPASIRGAKLGNASRRQPPPPRNRSSMCARPPPPGGGTPSISLIP